MHSLPYKIMQGITRCPAFFFSTLLLIGAVTPLSLNAQFHEKFETPTPTWERHETDCVIVESHWTQRRANELKSKNRYEKFSFETGSGSRILVSHPVPPSYVISELTPSLRIKSPRPGIQLMVRVVLPHTRSPEGNGPMTTLLKGPTYRHSGNWQTLSFKSESDDLTEKLKQELWLLRQKHGSQVSQRDAFIDKVVLNVFNGPGESTVQVDDLKLDGIVAADQVALSVAFSRNPNNGDQRAVKKDSRVRPVDYNQPLAKQDSLVVRDGTVLLVEQTPFFPRIIEHNGEPFEFLQSLGFNTIELTATATQQQLQTAKQLGLWIVCPAPPSMGIRAIDYKYDRVLAWSVGTKLTGRNLQNVQQQVQEIRESDFRKGRPIVGGAVSHWIRFAQHVDILSVGLEPVGTSFLASQYSDWISQRSQSIANSKPVWADIQTDLSKSLTKQISTIAKQVPPTPIEPQQMKFLVYEAITGGARGLRFKSHSRLDGAEPVARLRALTLNWINSDVARLQPWAAGGALMGTVPTDDPELEVTAIATNRSRLLLIQRPTHHEQYLAGDTPIRTVSFRDSDSTFTDRAYLISETGLLPLPNTRSVGGTELQIEQCPYLAAVVLTQDALITNQLNQSYRQFGVGEQGYQLGQSGQLGQSTFEMHAELTRQWVAIMQLIHNQMSQMGRSGPSTAAALNEALDAYRTATTLIENNSLETALPYLNRTDERLAFVRREMVIEPLGQFQSKTSTPLFAHTSLIPLHWELSGRLGSQGWNPNGLAGGDFENLERMTHGGWENRRLDDDHVSTKVELIDTAAIDGQYGLRMEVRPKQGAVALDAIPLWISSSRVPVRGGQLVRIHGWVNVPTVIQGNPDGLMITDSLGGPEMAERIPVTSGWQEFTLYRGADSDRDVQVTFALTGIGEAFIDEVTIRAVSLPTSVREARQTNP